MYVSRAGFQIYFEADDGAQGESVVLIAGSGEQIGSVEFPDEQCAMFAERGFRVIRMDNRDNGLSVPEEEPKPTGSANERAPAYSWLDMADDVAAVIDAVGESSTHVIGASLGGHLARWVAIRHPDKVRSLTLVMSASGADQGGLGPQVDMKIMRRVYESVAVRREREEAIEAMVEIWRWLWADHYDFEEAWVRERVSYAHDRSYRPEGAARNMLAALRTPALWEAQTAIGCPTLVFHGDRDPIHGADHARAIADQISGTRLVINDGMGHTMHRELWPRLSDEVAQLARASTAL